jgi:hypothetical protein
MRSSSAGRTSPIGSPSGFAGEAGEVRRFLQQQFDDVFGEFGVEDGRVEALLCRAS